MFQKQGHREEARALSARGRQGLTGKVCSRSDEYDRSCSMTLYKVVRYIQSLYKCLYALVSNLNKDEDYCNAKRKLSCFYKIIIFCKDTSILVLYYYGTRDERLEWPNNGTK